MNQGEQGAIARRRPYAGAAVLLVIGLMAGCGGSAPESFEPPTPTTAEPSPTDDAEPTDEPTGEPTSEPTEEPTPDPVETVQPPEWDPSMDEPTLDGAFAFGEYFMHLYSYVAATNDTELWLELSHPECKFCASTVDAAGRGVTGTVRSELIPISGEQLDPEYFSLDYYMDEWVGNEATPTRLIRRALSGQ